MKVLRGILILAILLAFVVIAIIYLTGDILHNFHNVKERVGVIAGSSFGVIVLVMIYLWIIWPSKTVAASFRPVVRTWTENNITALCTDADFRALHAESVDATIAWIEKRPTYMGFFTNSPQKRALLGPWLTGSVEDFRALVVGCRVESSKLFIPHEPIEAGQISMMTLKGMRERIYETSLDYEFRD